MKYRSPGTQRKTQTLLLVSILAVAALAVGTQWAWASDSGAPEPNYTWEGDERLSTTSDNGAFGPDLQVAGNDDLMMAYDHRVDDDTRNPYYRRSTNEGASWSAPAPIHTSDDDLRGVTLAFDTNNRAHAVWRSDDGLFHAAQNQWPTGSNTAHLSSGDILAPMLAIGSDNILHLVWQESNLPSSPNIYHAYSQDGGATWSSPADLADEIDLSSAPKVAVDSSGNVHVVWEERVIDGGFQFQIHYKQGTKSGSGYSWPSSATTVSGSAGTARRPALVANGQTIHLSYALQLSNEEQYPYYRRYSPGTGWSAPRDVSNDTPVSVNTNSPFYLLSTLQVCAGDVFIYYHGATEINEREQIWGTTSANNWTVVDVVTGEETRNIVPVLACIGGNLHLGYERIVVAEENHQIYHNVSNNENTLFLPLITRG